jgi:hypothetical protein
MFGQLGLGEYTMIKSMIVAASAALMFAMPVMAQEWPLKGGNYWDTSQIMVKDGGDLKYATHLANVWVRQMELLKANGDIKGYHILQNMYPRAGEATYVLITVYDRLLRPEEQEKRAAANRAAMNTTIAKMMEESGSRTEYRTVGSKGLYLEMMKR